MKDYPIGFQHQKDYYSCGAHAFSFAATLLGIPMYINESKKYCRTNSYLDSARKNLRMDKLISNPVKCYYKFLFDPGTSEKIGRAHV